MFQSLLHVIGRCQIGLLLSIHEVSGVAIGEEIAVLANCKSTKERNRISPSVCVIKFLHNVIGNANLTQFSSLNAPI